MPGEPLFMDDEFLRRKLIDEASNEDDQKDEKNKNFVNNLFKISPAIFIATVSLGFLIVHQKDIIEVYLNQFIQYVFSCINYLTIFGTITGALVFLIKFLVAKGQSLGYIGKRQQPENSSINVSDKHTLDDLMDTHFTRSNEDHHNGHNNNNNNNHNITGRLSPFQYVRHSPEMIRNYPRRHTVMDHDYFNRPPSSPVPPQMTYRSYSNSAIPGLLTQPIVSKYRMNRARTSYNRDELLGLDDYVGPQLSSSYPVSPPDTQFSFPPSQSGPPTFEHHTRLNSSYFPSTSPPDDNNPPTPQLHYSNSAILMPFAPSPVPEYSELDDNSNNEFVEKPSSKRQKFITQSRKLIFKRREESPRESDYVVDDFSCKPYGPPPRRYHGVNV
jgi:hypothetical protein